MKHSDFLIDIIKFKHFKILFLNSGEVAKTRAKDMAFVQRVKNRQRMQLGVKANKFQPHFRCQVVF